MLWLSVNGVLTTISKSLSHLRPRSTALGDCGWRLSSSPRVRVGVRQMALAGTAPPWAGVGGQSPQLVDEITQFRDMTSLRTSYTIYPSCLGFANDAGGRPERFDVEMGLKTSNPAAETATHATPPVLEKTEMCPSMH